ncbi:MAG TPA: hypothetical protein VF005_02395 [Acidimicrobiales bacterium]
MLDHVFLDVIAAMRRSFSEALLERQAVEERFQVDVLLGDLSWETSYSLPGEGTLPRVRADISLDWPTWSQSAYRSWSIGEPPDDQPEMLVEIALRIQRLARTPEPATIVGALPTEGPAMGGDVLDRCGLTVEQAFDRNNDQPRAAVEISYEGTYRLDETVLEDPSSLDAHVGALARWVSSTLVRLGDLELSFLPPGQVGDEADH